METQLSIIFDLSGSMNELGKIHIQRNLFRFIHQRKEIDEESYAGIQFGFHGWANSISEITLDTSGDIAQMEPSGQLNFRALSDFLSKLLSESSTQRVLILSDGHFSHDDLADFIKWKTSHDLAAIHVVAIGADANVFNLKKISSGDRVFLAENVSTALTTAIRSDDYPIDLPEFIAQILLSEPEKAQDDWDE